MAKHGIPDDFKSLAMAESGLSPDVVSSAGAAGLWQIMSATGKSYGLSVGGGVDERYDIEKSTEVACKYLLASYRRFGSWTLAAAAYNAGDAGVQRRMAKQGTSSYYDSFYPEETMRYVFRILSFKIVLSDPGLYGYAVAPGGYYLPLTVYLTVPVHAAKIDWL